MARWLVPSLLLLGSLFAPVPLVTAQGPVVDPPVDLNVTIDPPRALTHGMSPPTSLLVNATCPTPALYRNEVAIKYEVRGGPEWAEATLRDDDDGTPAEDRIFFGSQCVTGAVTVPLVVSIDGVVMEYARAAYDEAHFEIVVSQSGAEPVVAAWTIVVGWDGVLQYQAEPYLVDTADGGKAIRLTVTNLGNGALMVRPALWRDNGQPETTNTSVRLPSPRDAPELNQVTIDVPYVAVGGTETIAVGVIGEPVQDPGHIAAEYSYYVEVDPETGHVRSLEGDSFDFLPGPGIAPALALLGLAALALRRRVHP